MKSSTVIRYVLLLSVIALAWPLAGSMAARLNQKSGPLPAADSQKAGSILIYNFYKSDSSQKDNDTEINLANSPEGRAANVHLFFVSQTTCGVTDTYVCLPAGQSVTVRSSDYDPNGSGYVLAVAMDKASGLPVSHNFLTGNASVKSGDQTWKMGAVAIEAKFADVLPNVKSGDGVAAINFDGSANGYEFLPSMLKLRDVTSPAEGNNTLLVVNRIGGSLADRIAPVGALSGVFTDKEGNTRRFTAKAESCQLQSSLSKLLPNLDTLLPAGETAQIELSGLSTAAGTSINRIGGLIGAALNSNSRNASLASARNLEASASTEKISLTIPVGAVPSACRTLAFAGADLRMDMTGNPSLSVVRGQNITYDLTATNEGFDSAFNVVIRDSLPSTLTFVSAVPSSGGVCSTPAAGSSGTVTCTYGGTSGLNSNRTVTIVARVDDSLPSGSEIVNTGETYSSTSDPNGSNNSRTIRTTVTAVTGELVIATQSLPLGKINTAYSATLTAVNVVDPMVWSITGGVLPNGLNLEPSTGAITGTPTETGIFPITFRISDGAFRLVQKQLTLRILTQFNPVAADFDGDAKTDLSVWRGNTSDWFIKQSTDGTTKTAYWGYGFAPYDDVQVVGDYDGDGKADIAVWRRQNGYWFIINSSDQSIRYEQFGLSGDSPVPGDYDGDGKTDIAVWRGSTSQWLIKQSSTGTVREVIWGYDYAPYNDVPVQADYDGDGKTDIAVWRGNTSTWYIIRSSDGAIQLAIWGYSYAPYNDTPVPADYDGDGKADVAVWRGNTSTWYIIRSSTGQWATAIWGYSYAPYNDIPTPGDYDGDGKVDIAVWRSSTGEWFVIRSTDGQYIYQTFGQTGDTPIPR